MCETNRCIVGDHIGFMPANKAFVRNYLPKHPDDILEISIRQKTKRRFYISDELIIMTDDGSSGKKGR